MSAEIKSEVDVIHVEDNDSWRQLVRMDLKGIGCSVEQVTTLQGLRDILETTRARVFVLDATFPDRDGNEPVRNIDNAIDMITASDSSAHIIGYSTRNKPDRIEDQNWFNKGHVSGLPDRVEKLLAS